MTALTLKLGLMLGGLSGGGGEGEMAELVQVGLSADVTGVNATSTYTILWTSDVVDTGNRHDTGSNQNRITFNSGDVGKFAIVDVFVRMGLTAYTTYFQVGISHKNSGGTVKTSTALRTPASAGTLFRVVSFITSTIEDGDYIEATIEGDGDTSATLDDSSRLSMIIFG